MEFTLNSLMKMSHLQSGINVTISVIGLGSFQMGSLIEGPYFAFAGQKEDSFFWLVFKADSGRRTQGYRHVRLEELWSLGDTIWALYFGHEVVGLLRARTMAKGKG